MPRASALAIAVAIAGCAVGVGGDHDSSAVSIGEGGVTGTDEGQDGPSEGAIDESVSGADTEATDGDPETGGNGAEVCNGLDDDGDGAVDEDIGELSCGEGVCLATVAGCQGGVPGQCFPGQAGVESCNALDDDCDGATDEELVQACASSCGEGTQACTMGAWGECNAPPPVAEMCDVVDNDCNGAVDDGLAGCRIDIHRSYHPTTGEHFYTSSLEEAQCCGFVLEAQNYYRLYAGAQAGTTAFYRCYGAGPNSFHHYTTDAGCEGVPVNEGIIGYIGTAEIAGSTALYRSYNPQNGDHFFTTSQAEHDNAVAAYGFIDEGVAGYVW